MSNIKDLRHASIVSNTKSISQSGSQISTPNNLESVKHSIYNCTLIGHTKYSRTRL